LTGYGYQVTEVTRSIPELLARLQDMLLAFQKLDTGFTVKFVERDWLEIRNAVAEKEKRFARAKGLRNGTNGDNPREKDKKFPTRAIEEFRALQTDLRPVENVLIPDFFNRWSLNRQYLEKDERIKAYIASARDAEKKVKQLRENILEEIESATEQKKIAAALFQEARDDYIAASASFKAKQFNETLSYLERARLKANNSLANEEDPNVRNFLENDLVKLTNDTQAAGVKKRYDDALSRLNQGVDSYFVTNFDDAVIDLSRADQILSELPQDDNVKSLRSGIDNWRNLIEKARNRQVKRILTEKDVDYEVLRKRLNLAEDEYKAGLASKQQGNAAEAAKRFQNVKEQVKKVNEQYPYLEESGVLFLKVLKAEGEELYGREIDKRIRESESLFARDPKLGLAKLQDIYVIDPSYPGLGDKIKRYKDQLYGPPKIDQAKIDESTRWYREAQQLYRSGTLNRMKEALKLATAAYQANPYNKDILILIGLINLELSKSQ
jgi:hypothetical protein